MEISEIFENPAFWVLAAVGYGAFFAMIIILNKMNQSAIMPLWVKIVTIIAVPFVAAGFSGYASSG